VPFEQRVVIVCSALILLFTIFELVRKRRLREEYSWLWLLAGTVIMVAAFIPFKGLLFLAAQMGSTSPTVAIFFLGFLALIFLCLQFSVRLSRMTEQLKNLGQKVALLDASLIEKEALVAELSASARTQREKQAEDLEGESS